MSERVVYTAKELQKVLGLSRGAIYDRIADGTIPSVRVGGRILIPRTAIDELLGVAIAESRDATEQNRT
jgi:excisionase family DNA binding protein